MHNKKIKASVAALALGAVLIGGTYAWFTSTDTVVNKFQTGSINPELDDNGNGVEIWEDFEEPKNVVPGDTDTKLVQVQNTTTYDSFIRVRFEIKWEGVDSSIKDPDESLVQLNFADNLVGGENDYDGKWLKGSDGWYYYMGKVAGGKFTNPIIDSVTLSKDTPNEYRGAKYTVEVIAESIQADNDAHNDKWNTAGSTVTNKLDYYEKTTAIGKDFPASEKSTNGKVTTGETDKEQ